MTSTMSGPHHYVLHDRSVPACLRVSRALRLPLWGEGSPPLQGGDQLVVVLARVNQVRRVLDALRRVTGTRPGLVIAWGLPERQIASLLAAGVPTVDGSVITDPKSALAALDGQWDQQRFSEERELAEALAEMEAHLRSEETP